MSAATPLPEQQQNSTGPSASDPQPNGDQPGPKPNAVCGCGRVKAAAWNGERGWSVRLSKSFKDRTGVWRQDSITLFPDDIASLLVVAQQMASIVCPVTGPVDEQF